MMPSPISAALLVVLPACTFSPGQPWATLEVSLDTAPFSIPAERLAEGGTLRTTKSYGVALETLTLAPSSLWVTVAASAADLSFDPASPPEGYSLCHNGHCHADDGRLVDYADIERELRGMASEAGPALTIDTSAVINLLADDGSIRLEPCPDGCALLSPGTISGLSLVIPSVTLRATVFDLSAQGRLPIDGVTLDLTADVRASVSSLLALPVDDEHRPGVELAATLIVSPSVFDDIDFAALEGDAALIAALRAALEEHSQLVTYSSRFSP